MSRIICDYFEKGEKSIWGDDLSSPLNQKILAVKNMYAWLQDAGILQNVAFLRKESANAVCFALDAEDLRPYRQQMESSGVLGAQLATEHIFDREYTPCVYSGVIQLAWPMSSYRDVDGCVGRSWECELIKGLNTEGIYGVNKVLEEEGVKAAVHKLFSFYVWQEPERSGPVSEYAGKAADGSSVTIPADKLKAYLEEDLVLEFDSPEECMAYFNTYDSQSFQSVDEMKAYQSEYGFGIGEKWYHINFDEALDVYSRPSLEDRIQNASSRRDLPDPSSSPGIQHPER